MIWPPSKATSMRTRSSAATDDLREDAVDGVGMDERNLEPEEASAGPVVDQLGALGGQLVQRFADIRDLVRDVMHPRAALRKELPDRGLLTERGEQLDAVLAHPQRRRLDALVGHGLPVLEARPEEPLVGRDRLVEVGDRDAEMMDSARLHAAIVSSRQSAATARTVPTVSEERDSASMSLSSSPSSSLSSVSFSSSPLAIRSRAARCFCSSRIASWKASSVIRACSWSRRRLVSSESA